MITHGMVFVEPVGSTDCSKLVTCRWQVNCQRGSKRMEESWHEPSILPRENAVIRQYINEFIECVLQLPWLAYLDFALQEEYLHKFDVLLLPIKRKYLVRKCNPKTLNYECLGFNSNAFSWYFDTWCILGVIFEHFHYFQINTHLISGSEFETSFQNLRVASSLFPSH